MARHRSLSCNLNLDKDFEIVDFVNAKNNIGLRDATIVRRAMEFYMRYYEKEDEYKFLDKGLEQEFKVVNNAFEEAAVDSNVNHKNEQEGNNILFEDQALNNILAMGNQKKV